MIPHSLILSLIILTPLLGAGVLGLLKYPTHNSVRGTTLIFTFLTFLEIAWMYGLFDFSNLHSLQFVCKLNWIPALDIHYYLGIQGTRALLLGLVVMLISFSILATSRTIDNPKLFYSLMLITQSGLLGIFSAQNFFLWFLFWQMVMVSVYFLIILWKENPLDSSSTLFLIYSTSGSVMILMGFLALNAATGTFDFDALNALARDDKISSLMSPGLLNTAFFLILSGFLIQVPLFPFHSWMPKTYSQSTISVSMLLAGLINKTGFFGICAFVLPIFQDQIRAWLPLLLGLCALTIISSGWIAILQKDIKMLLSYCSITSLTYCLLGTFVVVKNSGVGLFPADDRTFALSGVMLHCVNHGIIICTLFFFLELLEKRIGGRRLLKDLGGIKRSAPLFSALLCFPIFASMGMPGLNGFIGFYLILEGSFSFFPVLTAICSFGIFLLALLGCNSILALFTGPEDLIKSSSFMEITFWEGCIVVPFIVLMLIIGIYPGIFLDTFISIGVEQILSTLHP